jgi:hypothetical protein
MSPIDMPQCGQIRSLISDDAFLDGTNPGGKYPDEIGFFLLYNCELDNFIGSFRQSLICTENIFN